MFVRPCVVLLLTWAARSVRLLAHLPQFLIGIAMVGTTLVGTFTLSILTHVIVTLSRFLTKRQALVTAFLLIAFFASHLQPRAHAAGASIYWGAQVWGQAPSAPNMQPGGVFDKFETRAGKKMSIIHWGQPWKMNGSYQPFQTAMFENVRKHGSIPMLNWASHHLGYGVNQPDFQHRDIYGGKHDAFITQWARDAKAWGKPFFLRFNHEMNGWWYPWGEGKTSDGTIVNGNQPGDYVKAWRHVHTIFKNVGATNVTWTWTPNFTSTNSRYAKLSTIYPGDAYVNWTGLSVYNEYSVWLSLDVLLTGSGQNWLQNSYQNMLAVAPNKPMVLAEVASIEAGDGGTKKAAWIKDAFGTKLPTLFPKIKAVVWYNHDNQRGEKYYIESSSASQNAFAQTIASSMYAANQFSTLNTSVIPALSGP